MTTELVTYENAEAGISAKTENGLFGGFFQKTRTNGGSGKVPRSGETFIKRKLTHEDIYNNEELIEEAQDRILDATCALLKKAQLMLDQAEEKMVTQEARLAFLEELATTDELTGLKNRRGFLESFVRELDRCERGISRGGLLVLIDLDNFKSVNDTFGHLAGDACLRLVGRTLETEIRRMDVASRLGGDEFVLLLSNTTKRAAAKRAQDLAWRLNNLAMAWYGEEIPVQASLGLRDYGPGDTVNKVFNDADMRLYASKQKKNGNDHNKQKETRMNND